MNLLRMRRAPGVVHREGRIPGRDVGLVDLRIRGDGGIRMFLGESLPNQRDDSRELLDGDDGKLFLHVRPPEDDIERSNTAGSRLGRLLVAVRA